MRKIHKLSPHLADLIAAGEVVERPMSVAKELLENAIDANATQIAIEIENGGISYLRVTDNGAGMSKNDAPIAFLRHATSKIYEDSDLNSIKTLGFRGEALAAISAVSKIDLFTKTKDDKNGTLVKVMAGNVQEISEIGANEGTTIIVRDLFYNTPARMKFLKKDYTEATYITSIVENIALSHPNIAFKYIKDGKIMLNTTGNNDLKTVIYNVLGKEDTKELLELKYYEMNGIKVHGFISKPSFSKATRAKQHFFVNGRYVKSKVILAALEEAYKNSMMHGKFPYGVINIAINESSVDVNVHPTKTEIKFENDKKIFDTIYFGCKETLNAQNIIVEPKNIKPVIREERTEFIQQTFPKIRSLTERVIEERKSNISSVLKNEENSLNSQIKYDITPEKVAVKPEIESEIKSIDKSEFFFKNIEKEVSSIESYDEENVQKPKQNVEITEKNTEETISNPVKIIGECFNTYILCEFDGELILIDKHAAHERLKFNELKSRNYHDESQILLTPKIITLSAENYGNFIENLEEINALGFEIEDFSDKNIVVRQIPVILANCDIENIILEIAESIVHNKMIKIDKIDDILHTIACKSAIKGNMYTSQKEMEYLAKQVLFNEDVNFCPHGRPVKVALSKYNIEKMFKRVL